MYPDHSFDYFSSDITSGGLDDTQGELLDIDFMYFDSKRDVELAKVLQTMAKKEPSLNGSRAAWDLHDTGSGC
jgi:hypothetical protein